MTAWERLVYKVMNTPKEMTVLDWVLWNGRNSSPQNLCAAAVDELEAIISERDELQNRFEAMQEKYGDALIELETLRKGMTG